MNENSVFRKAGEELKKDREKMKGKTPGQKIEYFFMYYKVPLILTAVVIAIAASLIYSHSRHREYAFHSYFVNAANTVSDETFDREFGEIIGIDTDHYAVSVDSSLYISGTSQISVVSTEKLASEINSEILDVCIMPEELFRVYSGQGAFGSLQDFLSEEQLALYADLLIYQDDLPVGIRADGFSKISGAGLYAPEDAPVFGIVYNTAHGDACASFLEYLK